MNFSVVFRCDAGKSAEIGTGHIVRCLMLADALVDNGAVLKDDILFLTRDDPDYSMGAGFLTNSKYAFRAVTDYGLAANSREEIESLEELASSILIMDRLETTADLINKVRAVGTKVITFDDYGSGRKYADKAISAIFDNVEKSSNLKYGYPYLILSRNAYNPNVISDLSSSLVATFGGYDARNLCSHFIASLNAIPNNIKVSIILGKTTATAVSKYEEKVELNNRQQQVKFYVQPDNFHEIISESDIGVASGGLSIFEFLAWGVPTIGLPQYPHQLRTIKKLQTEGMVRLGSRDMFLDKDKLGAEIANLFSNNKQRIEMAQSARTLIDGKGVMRIVKIIAAMKQKM